MSDTAPLAAASALTRDDLAAQLQDVMGGTRTGARCGVEHPPAPTRYARGHWSAADLETLLGDRALRVRVLDPMDTDTNKGCEAAAETGRPEARPRTGRQRGAE